MITLLILFPGSSYFRYCIDLISTLQIFSTRSFNYYKKLKSIDNFVFSPIMITLSINNVSWFVLLPVLYRFDINMSNIHSSNAWYRIVLDFVVSPTTAGYSDRQINTPKSTIKKYFWFHVLSSRVANHSHLYPRSSFKSNRNNLEPVWSTWHIRSRIHWHNYMYS